MTYLFAGLLATIGAAQVLPLTGAELKAAAEGITDWIAREEIAPDWNVEKSAKAADAAKVSVSLYRECNVRRRNQLQVSKESVADVVTAIMAGCASEESLMGRAFSLSLRGKLNPVDRQQMGEEGMKGSREKMREALTAYLVEYRLR